MVALPKSTHLVSKRIALGQIVIVYVIGFINGDQTEAVMHPVRVAASTGVGLLACVLALLLPVPRLAFKEVTYLCLQTMLHLCRKSFRSLGHIINTKYITLVRLNWTFSYFLK